MMTFLICGIMMHPIFIMRRCFACNLFEYPREVVLIVKAQLIGDFRYGKLRMVEHQFFGFCYLIFYDIIYRSVVESVLEISCHVLLSYIGASCKVVTRSDLSVMASYIWDRVS